jgi:ketosteroid isomerase-like protein
MHLLFFVAILLQVPAPNAATPTLPTQQWIQDMQTKNLDDVLALYTPDAVFVDPEGHQFATPDALRKLYIQVFATYDSDLSRGKGTIAIQGNPEVPGAIAVESAEFTENLRTRATNTTAKLCGDYRFTYILQQNGHWLISRMEWTSKACPATN